MVNACRTTPKRWRWTAQDSVWVWMCLNNELVGVTNLLLWSHDRERPVLSSTKASTSWILHQPEALNCCRMSKNVYFHSNEQRRIKSFITSGMLWCAYLPPLVNLSYNASMYSLNKTCHNGRSVVMVKMGTDKVQLYQMFCSFSRLILWNVFGFDGVPICQWKWIGFEINRFEAKNTVCVAETH